MTRAMLAGLLIIAVVAPATAAPPQLRVGDRLPAINGEFLTGRAVTLPDAAEGRVAVLLMGFTYTSRYPVEAWGRWFRAAFAGQPDVTFFEMPIIGGMAKLGRWFIDSGMRRGTPADLHEQVITVYSKSGDWKALLGVTGDTDKDAYVLLLDRHGVVSWMYHGAFDEARAAELGVRINELRP